MGQKKKICSKCGVPKPLNEFSRKKASKDGRETRCKVCCSIYNRKRYAKNPAKTKARSAKHYKDNPKKVNADSAKWGKKNPEKRKISRKKWVKKNPEKAKTIAKRTRLKKYGLSIDDFENMVDEQSNRCVICGEYEVIRNYKNGKIKELSIDHDHETGQVRELLCHRCNTMLGMAGDDFEILQKGSEYLKKWKGR